MEVIEAPVVNGYIFIRWQGALNNIIKDTTIKAIYDEICYNVTILDYNGNVIDSFEYFLADGYTMPEAPEIEGKTFIGWDHDINNLGNDEIDVTIKPLYRDKSITVTFEADGKVISTVAFSDDLDYPAVPIIEGKTFIGWDTVLSDILTSTTVKALYTTYYITYLDKDGKEIEKKAVTEHEIDYYPEAPIFGGFKFVKWDTVLKGLTINGNLTVKAIYEEYKCKVTYYDYYGKVIKTEEVEYGANASMDVEVPEIDGYKFTGFDKDGTNITEDTNINLLYEAKTTKGCNKQTIINLFTTISLLGLVIVFRRKHQ